MAPLNGHRRLDALKCLTRRLNKNCVAAHRFQPALEIEYPRVIGGVKKSVEDVAADGKRGRERPRPAVDGAVWISSSRAD